MRIKPYILILSLAVFLRLAIMPFFFHADLKSQFYHANFLSLGQFNIYSFLDTNRKNLPYQDTFNYPPLTYYFLGVTEIVIKPFLGEEYSKWQKNWGDFWFTNPQIFRQLFILKIPYLIFDILTGLLLASLVHQEFKRRVLILWFFNPISIYVIYALSNFDVIPTFFTILSLYFFKKGKYFRSGLSLGVGTALKLFPALVLPFFIISLYKLKKFKPVCDFGFGVLLLPVLTIVPVFRDFYLKADNGLFLKFLNNKIEIGQFQIPYFAAIYLLILFFYLGLQNYMGLIFNHFKKWQISFLPNWETLNFAIIIVFFGIFLGTRFHPQWLIWVVPFYLVLAAENFVFFLLFIPVFISYIFLAAAFRDPFLTLGIVSPILPNIYDSDFRTTTFFRMLSSEKAVFISKISFFIYLFLIILLIIFTKIYGKKINLMDKLNIWDKVSNFKLFLILNAFFLFVFCLVFALGIYYLSEKNFVTAQTEGYRGVPFYKGHPLSQNFYSTETNINQVYVRLKNINLVNREFVSFQLQDPDRGIIREVKVHGGAVADDDDIQFKFTPVPESANKEYKFILSSPTTTTGDAMYADVSVNDQLVYKVYRKLSYKETLINSLQSFWKKFAGDIYFAISYLVLLISVGIIIIMNLFRKFSTAKIE